MSIGSAPLIDSARLNQRTMGNEAFKVEVLALFVAEAERLLLQVERAGDVRTRADRLRAIAALAGGVGATRLAQTARSVEAANDHAPDIEPLRTVLAETLAYLHSRPV